MTAERYARHLYDGENRVCAVQSGTGMITKYIYDTSGNRVGRGTSTDFTTCDIDSTFQLTAEWVVDQSGEQVTELDGSGNWVHTNAFAGGQLVATLDTANHATYSSPAAHYQFSDWLGSRRVQVDPSGNLEQSCKNSPFGDLQDCLTTTLTTANDATEHHFTGKERDTESGNDFFGARYYNSNTGRWMSPDWSDTPSPIPYADLPNPQSLNLYSYVKNNPLSRTDADGHCDVDGEHHGGLWCFAHALGITETAKETQTRLANEASGFIAANHIGLIYVNGQWQQPSSASNAQLVDWWDAYNKDNQDNIAHGGRGLAFAGAAAGALTTPQARDLAKYLGFRPVNVDWDTHGQTVFEKNGRYISLDKDSHSGGVWKEFDRQGNRTGTLDAFLNKIGK